MKKLSNSVKSCQTSKFESLMNRISSAILIIGLVFFLSTIVRLFLDQLHINLFGKLNPVFLFIENHGINYGVIWSDISPFVCLWLTFICIIIILAANNFKKSIRDEYSVKTTSKIIFLNQQIDELEAANKLVNEAFRKYRNDTNAELTERQKRIDYYSERYDRVRDSKGHFLPKNK